MHFKTLLILFLLITPIIGFSQSQEISDWQQIHPNVIFIEGKDFTTEFEEKLTALNQEYIIYSNEISINDIQGYETQAYEKSTTGEIRNDGGNQLIKDWLGKNQDLKIISRSAFESASASKQDLLINSNALILVGEKLTISDIENYEINH